uniref:Uncharacterized protein n=1 Tax=Anopheles atroparvus TaxID=41427 RepID=A0AAG5DHG9_ANOAO
MRPILRHARVRKFPSRCLLSSTADHVDVCVFLEAGRCKIGSLLLSWYSTNES